MTLWEFAALFPTWIPEWLIQIAYYWPNSYY